MDVSAVEEYLLRGEYPLAYSKSDKANLRRHCRNNFKIDDGIMRYHTARKVAKCAGEEAEESEWKVCVRSQEEKKRIMESCHGGKSGKK